MKRIISAFAAVFVLALIVMTQVGGSEKSGGYIKYVEFNVTEEALKSAVDYDIATYDDDVHIEFITVLAYLGAKYGGDFSRYSYDDMSDFCSRLQSGESVSEITKDMVYYDYYLEAYTAALDGMVGAYEEEYADESGEVSVRSGYGISWFSPIAKSFPYSDYDDFGASRSFGYERPHLGHDMMSAVGTPVIAVESGTVECLGWNMYGGWRIGIRSDDKKRYWYYAHLRQNRPYAEGLSEGDYIEAGDVIGYVGRTGYSTTENVNGIDESHLHIGLELIFDESQKDSDNEIWIDLYAVMNVLRSRQSSVVRNSETKEFTREYSFKQN